MTSIKFRALTHNDHKLFFEALGEYGKDFQNIQQYMAQKCGKSSNKSSDQNKSIDPQEKKEQDKKEEDKKREQIRNFYNKLYTKLCQLVGKLDDRVEKVNQELYLLINYGEIWKKHGFKFNNKTKRLLEELVQQGYTTLRFKNKNVRLRTPPCKALKKINEIGVDEKVKVVTTRELPKDVIVEFHPATNRDWIKVQSMAQNPLVRARLSIQKRLSNILEFLEYKWNISQEKLTRTVDVWLKVSPNNQQSIEDLQQQQQGTSNSISNGHSNNNLRPEANSGNAILASTSSEQNQSTSSNDVHLRLRLKPSAQHELKEVNITRVVPDNHLDLSLNAYIKRFGESIVNNREQSATKSNSNKDTSANSLQNASDDGVIMSEPLELSQGGMSSSSRLPVSLTTPDSSILLERSCTSDQPSIAQARKHLNILQSLAGSFEGCENSRTACEDTQDRSLLIPPVSENRPNFGNRIVSFADIDSNKPSSITVSTNLPAIFDEDAAIDTNMANASQEKLAIEQFRSQKNLSQNSDDQNSKSVDFTIPTNVSLGDWFTKMTGRSGGDDANDAFPLNQTIYETDNIAIEECNKDDPIESPETKVEPSITGNNSSKPQNHMIDVKKLAEGWTRQDESTMTVGELYLAFKCPEKILLEYEFEQFTYKGPQTEQDGASTNPTTIFPENPSNNEFIFKLLTAASLSLAQIERQKEEQHKLHEQSSSKLKRRKGPSNPNTIKFLKRDDVLSSNKFMKAAASGLPNESDGSSNNQNSTNQHNTYNNNYISTSNDKNQGQGQAMTLHDIETTNQRVGEALKLLQPTRLSVFRRAR